MKTVTKLRANRPGSVAVELDDEPWRTLPLEAVVKARITEGAPHDRARARELAREVRRLAALGTALKALRHLDRSAAELEGRLRTNGVAPAERERALVTLSRVGLLDDERVARARAGVLAERGNGDELIRHDLERRGIPSAAIEVALAALRPEPERAAAILARRGSSLGTARYLAARGFGEDAVESAVAWEGDEEVG